MRDVFQSLYFKSYLFCFIGALLLLLYFSYGDVVLLINGSKVGLLDGIMPWLTYLGDGLFFALVALGLLIYRWRLGLFFAIAGVVQAGVTALLKRVVFGNVPRPTKYFEELGVKLELIPGVDHASYFSFPSGHTMTVFMMTSLLCFTIVPRRYHISLLCLAMLGGITRIYLLQHFLQDVVAGSLVGVMLAAVLTITLYPKLVRPVSTP